MLSLFASLALAGTPKIVIEGGLSHDMNLAYENVWGVTADAHASLGEFPWLGVGATGVVYLVGGDVGCADPNWSPLTCQLVQENGTTALVSYPTSRFAGYLRAAPFRTRMGDDGMATGLRVGAGVVATRDDLVASQSESEEVAVSVQNQLHVAPQVGGFAEAWWGRRGLAVHADVLAYTEDYGLAGERVEKRRFPLFLDVTARVAF